MAASGVSAVASSHAGNGNSQYHLSPSLSLMVRINPLFLFKPYFFLMAEKMY